MTLPQPQKQVFPLSKRTRLSVVLRVSKMTIDPKSDEAWTGSTLLQPVAFKSGRHLS